MPEKFCCRVCQCGTYLPVRIFGSPEQALMTAGGIRIAIGKVNALVAQQDCLYTCMNCSAIFTNPDKFSLTTQETFERGKREKAIRALYEYAPHLA